MDIQAGGFTARLSKAESDINQAAKNLEKAFHGANSVSRESGYVGLAMILRLICSTVSKSLHHREQELPDPIRLVRRITALEIALGNLKKDCEIVSERRSEVVQNVLSMQSDTVARVKEVCAVICHWDGFASFFSRESLSCSSCGGQRTKIPTLAMMTQLMKHGSPSLRALRSRWAYCVEQRQRNRDRFQF